MTIARKNIVDKSESGFYHCTTRCVRRAFLCGEDPYTGENYDHRREWIQSRILKLGGIFAADVYAYAVMHNHYHITLFMDVDRASHWTDEEVARRWLTLCPPKLAIHQSPESPSEADCFNSFVTELTQDQDKIDCYRQRLGDLSWLMRFLNEHIARKANREDQVKGRFWEGRFKTQALLDEGAVLACMAYVDLNLIRAGIAKTPEQSEFTSVKDRIEAEPTPSETLKPLSGTPQFHTHTAQINAIVVSDYLQLVDWTGRQIREGKTGKIPVHLSPILQRLQLNAESWLETSQHFGSRFGVAAGHWNNIRNKAMQTGRNWLQGMSMSRRVYCLSLD